MVTDTSIVRDYCLANGGGVFDLNYLSANLFRDIPHVNLRKIVTRLCDSGVLRQVSKGVYFLGESEATDDFRLEDHYTFDGHVRVGMLIGQSLLYKLGFCKYELEEKVIRTSKTVGNKKIGNLQILETKSDIADGALHTYENSSVVSLLGGSGALRKEKIIWDRAVLGQDQPIPR